MGNGAKEFQLLVGDLVKCVERGAKWVKNQINRGD